MKKKLLFFAVGFFMIGLVCNMTKAETTSCEGCYISPPWGTGAEYTRVVRGDCYADWMLCGAVIICGSGSNTCDPWHCNTEFPVCTETMPN